MLPGKNSLDIVLRKSVPSYCFNILYLRFLDSSTFSLVFGEAKISTNHPQPKNQRIQWEQKLNLYYGRSVKMTKYFFGWILGRLIPRRKNKTYKTRKKHHFGGAFRWFSWRFGHYKLASIPMNADAGVIKISRHVPGVVPQQETQKTVKKKAAYQLANFNQRHCFQLL